MKFQKVSDAEISSNRQYVVGLPDGSFTLAKIFGGRTSRSGATLWPEWIQEGAMAIKPLSLLTEQDIDGKEVVVAFTGGGGWRVVTIYSATPGSVRNALEQWRQWRRGAYAERTDIDLPQADDEPPKRSRLPRLSDPEPEVVCDADWIARSISFNESWRVDGRRLTNHEVSRHAEAISQEWDAGSDAVRWTAKMKVWPMMATALDQGRGPITWWLYEMEPQEHSAPAEDFVEVEEE